MTASKRERTRRPARSASSRDSRSRTGAGDLSFGRRNYAVLGAALASIVIGFILLGQGSITAAPVLLVLGYCVLVPYGLATVRGTTRDGTPVSGE